MVSRSTSSSTKPVQLESRRQLVAVLVGVESDDAGLEPQRQVLGDDGDLVSFVGQVLGDGEDPVVVVVRRHRGRERGRCPGGSARPAACRPLRWRAMRRSADPSGETVRASATLGAPPTRARDGPASPRARMSTTIGSTTSCSVEAHERQRVREHHRGVEDVRARHVGARGGRIGHGHPIGIRLPRPRSLRRRSCCSAMSLGHMKPPPRPLVVDGSALTGVVERCERRSASDGAATHGLRGRGTQTHGLRGRGTQTHGLRGRGTQKHADILVACPACSARSSPVSVPRSSCSTRTTSSRSSTSGRCFRGTRCSCRRRTTRRSSICHRS